MNKEIESIIRENVDAGLFAGVSTLILYKGEEIFYYDYGYADIEAGKAMSRDTIIRLYSMTKPITAVGALQLFEKGRLDMWDRVSDYLPEYANLKVYDSDGSIRDAKRPLFIRDLLNMTSGIPYPENWEGCSRSGRDMDKLLEPIIRSIGRGERITTREIVRSIAEVPLVFDPGERWMYGLSADILGAIIEIISGSSLDEYFRENIFEPLQMDDTGFRLPKDKLGRFAMSYDYIDSHLVPCDETHLGEYYLDDVKPGELYESAGAGLYSTIDDYGTFARMLVEGGKLGDERLLGSRTVDFMAANALRPEQAGGLDWESNRGYGYGCLTRTLIDPMYSGTIAPVGEFGWDGWTGNYCSIDPVNDLVILIFLQRRGGGADRMIRAIRTITYSTID